MATRCNKVKIQNVLHPVLLPVNDLLTYSVNESLTTQGGSMPRPGIQLEELRATAQTLARKFGIRRWERERGALGLVEHAGTQRNLFGPDRDDVELALQLVAFARYEVDVAEFRLITAAREEGLSWAVIAARLNLSSRQAAEQRYLRLQAVAHHDAASWRERDPQLVRRERRRQQQLVNGLAEVQPFLEEFSSAIQRDVLTFPDRWEKLPDNGTDTDRRRTTVLLETRIRALRSTNGRAGTTAPPQSLFFALHGLVTTLQGGGYPIGDLPTELLEYIEKFERLAEALADLLPPPRRGRTGA